MTILNEIVEQYRQNNNIVQYLHETYKFDVLHSNKRNTMTKKSVIKGNERFMAFLQGQGVVLEKNPNLPYTRFKQGSISFRVSGGCLIYPEGIVESLYAFNQLKLESI